MEAPQIMEVVRLMVTMAPVMAILKELNKKVTWLEQMFQ